MESLKENKIKKVLVSGASIAGFSTAYWMNRLGYKVTVVEIANAPRTAGSAVDIRGNTVDIAKRMGIFDQLKSNRLNVEMIEFKNSDDVTEGKMLLNEEGEPLPDDEIEIERDKFISILFEDLKNDVEFIFNNSITALNETKDSIEVTFKDGLERSFDLVLGCDGMHSVVRKLWFGQENEYAHFLKGYFSITIVNKLLIKQKTMQMYNVPDKAITLNAYNNKTDIIFCFFSEEEIPYNYRDIDQQRNIILAFEDYNKNLRPFIDEVQATAELNVRENFIPRTEEAIRKRNIEGF